MIEERRECHRYIISEIAPAACIEVDQMHVASVKKVVPLVNIGVDQAEYLRPLSQHAHRLPDPLGNSIQHAAITWR